MNLCTVKTIYSFINQLAPFETAEEWDNVGLIVGSLSHEVTGILCALDCTEKVLEEALLLGPNVIFTHHPLLFNGTKQIHTHQGEGAIIAKLIQNNITLISAHTNADLAPMGTSHTLANLFDLRDITKEQYVITGTLPMPMTGDALCRLAQEKLSAPVRIYGSEDKLIHRLSVGAGAYGEGYEIAKNHGAQGYLSSEFKHHEIIQAVSQGLTLFDGGHFATEVPGLFSLGQCLQNTLNELQYKVVVYYSSLHPYRP